jgi:Spy/CpxP family protein refolding chaperone
VIAVRRRSPWQEIDHVEDDMKEKNAIISLLPIALSLALACNHGENAAPPGATNSPVATGAIANEAHREKGEQRTDPTNALLRATADLKLTDAQKATIHALEEQLEANERDTGAAFKAQRVGLAALVRAGSIDQAKEQADESAAIAALRAHIAKEADILSGLHAALDSSQRKAAVAAARASNAGRAEVQPHPGAPEQSEEHRAEKRLDRLTRELGLDATQRQQVAPLLVTEASPKRRPNDERQHRMDTLLTAFESDTFDARTAGPAPSSSFADRIRERVEGQVALLAKLLPILRAEQREKLASRIETGVMEGHDDD